MEYSKILELHKLALRQIEPYTKKRLVFRKIVSELQHQKRILAIVGPRGAGKTVLLRQLAAQIQQAIYISLDSIENFDLFENIKTLAQVYKYSLFLFDEIHYVKNYERELKKIYDFLNVQIICTSSSALSIHQSTHDLSRRIKIEEMFPFSYREFLYFKEDILLEPLTLSDIVEDNYSPEYLRYGYLFDDYLKGQLWPFALEEADVFSVLNNVLQKIINRDVPAMVNLRMDELNIINKLIRFIGLSDVDGINYSSLSRNIGITKFKAESYLRLLEKAYVLRIIFPGGTNVLKEPKVLMQVPYRLLFNDYQLALGGLREDYFAMALSQARFNFSYLKSIRGSKTPDYLVEDGKKKTIIEVGGKGKGRQQFKGISGTKQVVFYHGDIPQGIKKPLFLLGFLSGDDK